MEGRLLRSYKRSFNGFAARLTDSEREQVAGECSSRPEQSVRIQSYDFCLHMVLSVWIFLADL